MGQKMIDGKEHFYIHWKGYPAEDDSREPRENLALKTIAIWKKSQSSDRHTAKTARTPTLVKIDTYAQTTCTSALSGMHDAL